MFLFALASVAPFKVRVNFDENEHPANVDPSIDDSNYQDGECNLRPGGIIGISFFFAYCNNYIKRI